MMEDMFASNGDFILYLILAVCIAVLACTAAIMFYKNDYDELFNKPDDDQNFV